jgi:hypothetical protein
MGITLTPASAEPDPIPIKREPKARFTNGNLPFMSLGYNENLRLWQTNIMSGILEWAGTLDEPFGAASHPNFKAITTATWQNQFPDIDPTDAVYSLVGSRIFCLTLVDDLLIIRLRPGYEIGSVRLVNERSVS